MGYSYRTDLKHPGVYTLTLDGEDVGVLSMLWVQSGAVLRGICEVLDQAAKAGAA